MELLLDFGGVDFFFSSGALLALLALFGFGLDGCGRVLVGNACSSTRLVRSKLGVSLVIQGDVLVERLACFVGDVHIFVGCAAGATDANQEFLLHRVGDLG